MNQATVLIIEDEPATAREIQITLLRLGYQVVGPASSSSEALQLAESYHPDVVLVDVALRGSADGIQTAQHIRLLFDIPVIFLTAYTDESILQRVRLAEPIGYVLKPYEAQELRSSIEIGLYKHRMERRLRRQSRQLEMRVQELDCLYKVSRLLGRHSSETDSVYSDLVLLIPPACQYPELASVSLLLQGRSYTTRDYAATRWCMCVPVAVEGEQIGSLEVCYTQEPPNGEQVPGTFLAEESQMLQLIAELIGQSIEHEKADVQLRASEARYRAVSEDMPALVCRFLPDGELTFVNQQYCQYFNVSRDDLLGANFFQFIPEDQRQEVCEHYQSLTAARPSISYEHQVLAPSGELRWQRWTDRGLFNPAGQLVEYQSVGEDITEQRLAEDTLRASEAQHRQRFETMTQGILYVNQAGVITTANPAIEHIFNIPVSQVIGKSFNDMRSIFIHEDGSPILPYECPVVRALSTGLPVRDTVIGFANPQENDWRWLMASAHPQFREGEETPYQAFIVLNDITRLVKAEHALTRRWALEKAMGEIASRFANSTDFNESVQFALQRVGELGSADRVGLFLRKPGQLMLSLASEWCSSRVAPIPHTLHEFSYTPFAYSGELLLHGERLPVEDRDCLPAQAAPEKQMMAELGLRGCLMLPVRVGSSFTGLFVSGTADAHIWNDEDYSLVGLVVEVLSGAIERQRALDAERASRQQAEILRQAISALTSELNLDQLLNTILKHLDELVTNDIAFILLEEGGKLKLKASRGMPSNASIGPDCLEANYQLFQQIAEDGVPLVLADIKDDSRVNCPPELGDIHGWMGLPLRARGQVQGYLVIISHARNAYGPADVALAQTFADQGAIAIENARLYEQAHYFSITDPLTEVFNRRHFFDLARHEFERFRRYNGSLSTIILDIDRFKLVNDTYGHIAGDLTLKEVVRRLSANLRASDVLARYGGEEFVILMPQTALPEALQVAERLRCAVSDTPVQTPGAEFRISVSLGVAAAAEDCTEPDALLQRADQALYLAKEMGRNRAAAWRVESYENIK